jgi:hypothetical protein
MDEKSQGIRSLLPRFGVRRKPLRGVAEIVLGHPLEGRDSLAVAGIAERQVRAPAQEAVKHQTTEDASLQAEKVARKAAEGRPRSNANARELAERAEADLVQERARSQELEKKLPIRQNDQKLAPPDSPSLEVEPKPAEASLPPERKLPWQHKSKVLVPSGVLLLLVAGAAGYAVFHVRSPRHCRLADCGGRCACSPLNCIHCR